MWFCYCLNVWLATISQKMTMTVMPPMMSRTAILMKLISLQYQWVIIYLHWSRLVVVIHVVLWPSSTLTLPKQPTEWNNFSDASVCTRFWISNLLHRCNDYKQWSLFSEHYFVINISIAVRFQLQLNLQHFVPFVNPLFIYQKWIPVAFSHGTGMNWVHIWS